MKYDDEIYNHYKIYRSVVDNLTDLLKVSGKLDIKRGQTIDHILPVSFGFNWRIPPNIMADVRNIRILSREDNSKKGYKCKEIPKFIQKFMINDHHRCIKEKQMEGIRKAKLEGKFKGRVKGSFEKVDDFLKKPKIKEVVFYLKQNYKYKQIIEKVDIHPNTIYKVKKILKERDEI